MHSFSYKDERNDGHEFEYFVSGQQVPTTVHLDIANGPFFTDGSVADFKYSWATTVSAAV